MTPVPLNGPPSPATVAETAPPLTTRRGEGVLPSSDRRSRKILIFLALLLLHGTNPLAWGEIDSISWFPPAGVALTLIAWFGVRAALWTALDGLLVVAQALLLGRLRMGAEAGVAAFDAVAGAAWLALAWRLYRRQTSGTRDVRDPHSAKLFLFLLPCLGVGAWALTHSAAAMWLDPSAQLWQTECAAFWLRHALGAMILTPLLLVVLTPWLMRSGLLRREREEGDTAGSLDGGTEPWSKGDGLEIAGLAFAAGALTWLAARTGRTQPVSWELWGTPLLLIVWASLRQGVRGATLVAFVSASAPLLLSNGEAINALVQVNLLGQCAVALLVSTSASWVRLSEQRSRQVAGYLPVVLYSARFRRPQRPPLTASDLDAEVTLVSAGSERLLGCPPRELLGEHERWLGHVHAGDREVLHAALVQLGRQVQPVTCEYRVAESPASAAPAVRWLRDTLAPHLDDQGRLIGWEGVITEISEQRELADDLRRTTSMLHALVGNLPAGVFFVQGPLGQPILVNARARQLLGQREDTAASLEHLAEVYRLHRADGSLYPVEDLPVYQALRNGLSAMRDDIIVHRPDGRRTPLVTWAAPVTLASNGHGRGNGPEAAVWVLEDLTALHQAEAARRDTEIRLRAILETMSEGVVVQDYNGGVLDCNAAAGALLGLPPERLRGLSLAECDWRLLSEDGSPLAQEDYPAAEVLRLGRPVRNRVVAVVPHGGDGEIAERQFKELRWVLVNAMPLAAGSGGEQAALGVVSTYIDITTTVRARRLLHESEEKYRELVESLPIVVILSDVNRRIVYANSAMRKQTGYDLSEIAEPEAWSRLIHADDLGALHALAHEALQGCSGRAEYRYRAKDGSEKVGLAFTEPRRRSDGTIVGATTLIADVTRERQLEQELLRAQRLELVGRLSSGIAHDFNNLLSVVLSLTELVAMNLPAEHAAQQDLGHIREATEQAANLASQLLTFSKQRRIAAHRFDINSIVARTLELLRATLPARIDLQAELAEQELFVEADETQVQQVLMNLCLNARDAMPDGGRLRVRTERVSTEGEWVRLSVCDSGIGLSEAVKAHLFDPFYSTKERGTGLGLAVVRQIVESHGGRVEAVGTTGQGARFDVWWPASL
jgi:PAS domain S-box-containing protein